MKKVLVTGASGFIGRHLCARLNQRGVYVRALNRRPSEGPWDESIVCDLGRDAIPGGALDGIDTVFHLAARVHQLADCPNKEKAYMQGDIQATQQLLQAAECAGVACFVFFSSLKAMGDVTKPGECRDESFGVIPESLYGSLKLKSEGMVKSSSIPHVCILRPAMVYGAGCKGNLPRMIKAIASGWFLPLPDAGNRRSMIHVDDVVDAALRAAESPQAAGEIYILTDGMVYSNRQIYEWVCEALSRPVPRWEVPMIALKFLGRIGDGIGLICGKRFVFDSTALQKLTESAWYSSKKIQQELGFRPGHTLRESLPELVHYLGLG